MVFDTDLITSDLVFMGWDASTPGAVFTRLNQVLLPAGYVHPTWEAAVAERERLYPTGLATPDGGIALPHADPPHVARPFIAVVKPASPVVFRPIAGMGGPVPAELIICLGFTNAMEQLAALQHLMNVFMDETRAARVLAQTTPEGLAAALAEN